MAAHGRGVSGVVGLVPHEPSAADSDRQTEAPPFRPRCLPKDQPSVLAEAIGAVFAVGMFATFLLWLSIPVIAAVWVVVEAVKGAELLWRLM